MPVRTFTDGSETEKTAQGQIDGSWTYRRNSNGSNGTELTSRQRAWTYDSALNRKQQTGGTGTSIYERNTLDQIENVTGSGATDPSYDYAGNVTNLDGWAILYDSENRPYRMTNTTLDKRLEFTYDYMGRRVQKTVSTVAGGSSTVTKFVYDGWNLIAELDTNSKVLRSFTWGMDASGGQAAGGVGGLLHFSVHNSNETVAASFLPIYDLSHNIVGWTRRSDGVTMAAYTYTPFGERTTTAGDPTFNTTNASGFGFSTKYTDAETGLVYYGLRYHSPKLGRFINRDPIQESGGLNLYAHTGNDPVNRLDVLGLDYEICYSQSYNAVVRYADTNEIITVAKDAASDVWCEIVYEREDERFPRPSRGAQDLYGGRGSFDDWVDGFAGSDDPPDAANSDSNGSSIPETGASGKPWEFAGGLGVSGTVSIPGVSALVSVEVSKTFHVLTGWPPSFKFCMNVSFTVGVSPTPFVGVGIEIPIGISGDGTLEGPAVSTGMAAGAGGGVFVPVEGSIGVAKNDNAPNITAAGSGTGFGPGIGAYAGPVKVFSGTACYTPSARALLPGIRELDDIKATKEALDQAVQAAIAYLQGRM